MTIINLQTMNIQLMDQLGGKRLLMSRLQV